MKKNKLKSYSVKFGVAFFIILALLTFFSSTIDNMLLPKVQISNVQAGSLNEDDSSLVTRYLLPLSSVSSDGDTGTVFILNFDENNNKIVREVFVKINASDDLYYEVTSEGLYSEMQVVYKTSKSISDGDRVYVEEEE